MGTLREDWYTYLVEFLEWEMFWAEVVDKTKTHFIFRNVFWKIMPFMR